MIARYSSIDHSPSLQPYPPVTRSAPVNRIAPYQEYLSLPEVRARGNHPTLSQRADADAYIQPLESEDTVSENMAINNEDNTPRSPNFVRVLPRDSLYYSRPLLR